ncbi:transposable element Tcb1 transposase [Trichonephila clavipes]|nr:transposable element Tcb1 transposase [Trichonephila clavipes]
MDDNATCHQTLAVQDCLDSEGIQRLVWPVRSPDLNPIENVWDALGRQVSGRNYPPTNKNTLIRALTEEWDKLPQQLLDNVVQSTQLSSSVVSFDLSKHLPDYYNDEDFDRVKDSLASRLVSQTSTETTSTFEKSGVSSDNYSLFPCAEVKWIRNIGRNVTDTR